MKRLKKLLLVIGVCILGTMLLTGCGGGGKSAKRELKVYNWCDYIDPEVLKIFEKETGIHVVYDTFATNEEMYVKIKAGGSDYDLGIPSDYMIERLVKNNLIEKIDMKKIPNYKLIGKKHKGLPFDKNEEYSVPAFWGTVGIVYNKKMVSDPVDSWTILWNEKYKKQIFMVDSPRDSIGVTLKMLGYSLNTHDKAQLMAARDKLIEQKPLVLAYVVDEVKDKMIAGEGAMAVVWSGDAMFMIEKNKDLAYALPKEGTNIWVDSMVIFKGGKNKKEAEEFINFMCRPDIAKKNTEYIGYATPIPEVQKQLDKEVQECIAAYPGDELLKDTEYFLDPPEDVLALYDKVWTEVKVAR